MSMKPLQISMFSRDPEVKRMAREETPQYRMAVLGGSALSYREVIAVLLGEMPNCMEMARAISERWRDPRELQKAELDDLLTVPGIGPNRAARILAAYELGRRVSLTEPLEKYHVQSPSDAAGMVLYDMSALEQEELRIILLDQRNRVMDIISLYRGSVNQSQVRVSELFKAAVRRNAVSIIVVHNHPSGDPAPSPDDVALTRAIVQAGKLLDIDVLDHLIIGAGKWVSLKERGLGFGG